MHHPSIPAFLTMSIIGFVLSLLAHGATFLGMNPQQAFPWVWALHLGIFAALLPLLFILKQKTGAPFGRIDTRAIARTVPPWLKIVCGIFIAYAAVNFALGIGLSQGGAPDIWDGRYVLQNKGTLIRELTAQEYQLHQAYEVRIFSGHWMVFYLLIAAAYSSCLSQDRAKPNELQ